MYNICIYIYIYIYNATLYIYIYIYIYIYNYITLVFYRQKISESYRIHKVRTNILNENQNIFHLFQIFDEKYLIQFVTLFFYMNIADIINLSLKFI